MKLQDHPDYPRISAECKSWALKLPKIKGPSDSFAKDTGAVCEFLKKAIHLQHPKHRFGNDVGFVRSVCDELRNKFLGFYRGDIYSELTDGFAESIRIEALVERASIKFPGVLASKEQVEEDSGRKLKDKSGYERSIGIFLSHMFTDPCAGNHLIQAMLQPLPSSFELLEKFIQDETLDLGMAFVRRNGAAVEVRMHNPRYLNAEDSGTLIPMEQAIDVALLDPHSEICVLRGTESSHPRYKNRGIFCSGINLTHLYEGRIPYLWYIIRDLGFVNKMAHGLYTGSTQIRDPMPTLEKPWIAAVETFAIGGGCQYLLVMDHTIAEETSYFTLPARKEGIIPGLANMRLPRFVGDRISRQAIMFDRRIDANSAEGRLIADQIVPDGSMDHAVSKTVEKLTSSGVVSAAGNRKALRVCQETLDDVRRYMAVYSREQVNCHLSPALVRNLEENWLKPKNRPTQ